MEAPNDWKYDQMETVRGRILIDHWTDYLTQAHNLIDRGYVLDTDVDALAKKLQSINRSNEEETAPTVSPPKQ